MSELFSIPDGVQGVVLFSGGRTSGYMMRKLMFKYPDYRSRFITIFCNTGKEMPATLNFVHDCEVKWRVPIIWLEYARTPATPTIAEMFPTKKRIANVLAQAIAMETTHWFKIVNYKTASRDGKPFDDLLKWMTVLPNVVSRGCSMQLKIRTAMRYLFSLGLKQYASIIGIRNDERHRATQILANCDSFEHPQFPLCDWNKTESDVLAFWRVNDFDLRLESYKGNCDLCFLKSKAKRVRIAKEHPELIGWWKAWEAKKANAGENRNGKYFRLNEPYELIEKLSQERDLFDQTSSEPDIPCSCAERGFDNEDEIVEQCNV